MQKREKLLAARSVCPLRGIHALLVAILIGVITIGSIGVGVLANHVNGIDGTELKSSVLKQDKESGKSAPASKKTKKVKKKKSAQALLAELHSSDLEGTDPLTFCLYAPPEKPEYKAEVVTRDTRVWVLEGGEFEASIYVKNTGNTAWFGDSSPCTGMNFVRLGTTRAKDRNSIFFNPGDPHWLKTNRIAMMEPRVDPGQMATFTFRSKAPMVTDIFREYFAPVIENTVWLDSRDATAYVDVWTGENPTDFERSLKYLGFSGQASTINPDAEKVIEVDISEQTLKFKVGETVVRNFRVSTGTFSTPTPIGRFKIFLKQELRIGNKWPHYHMPNFMMFTEQGAGFHALPYLANDGGIFWNEALNHIGQRASHGCIRLLTEEAADLFEISDIGTAVWTHY